MITRKETAEKNIAKGTPKVHIWSPELLADEDLCLKAVKVSGTSLCSIPPKCRTQEMCSIAAKNGAFIGWIDEKFRNEEVCKYAVADNGRHLRYVPEDVMTQEICDIAMDNCSGALQFIPEKFQTIEMCKKAFSGSGTSLSYVADKYKTREICELAVRLNGFNLEYVPEYLKTTALCALAVNNYGEAFRYVPDHLKTQHLCLVAVQRGCSIRSIPERYRTEELYLMYLRNNGSMSYVPHDVIINALDFAVRHRGGSQIVPTSEEREQWSDYLYESLSYVAEDYEEYEPVPGDPLEIYLDKFLCWAKERNGGYSWSGNQEDRLCAWIAQEYRKKYKTA